MQHDANQTLWNLIIVFCDEAVPLCTAQPRNLFMFSEVGSKLAGNFSVARTAAKPVKREKLLFLRPQKKPTTSRPMQKEMKRYQSRKAGVLTKFE